MLILYVLHYDPMLGRLVILSLLLMLMIFIDVFVNRRSENFLKSLIQRSQTNIIKD